MILGTSWEHRRTSWGHLGASWGHHVDHPAAIAAVWGRLGTILEASWGTLGHLEGTLGRHCSQLPRLRIETEARLDSGLGDGRLPGAGGVSINRE